MFVIEVFDPEENKNGWAVNEEGSISITFNLKEATRYETSIEANRARFYIYADYKPTIVKLQEEKASDNP
jgi:hypothetical protein